MDSSRLEEVIRSTENHFMSLVHFTLDVQLQYMALRGMYCIFVGFGINQHYLAIKDLQIYQTD